VFDMEERCLDAPGLSLRYHRVPWDEPIFGAPVAAISAITITDPARAAEAWPAFAGWCRGEQTVLVSCRLPQKKLVECGFLEARGFRFIELNYRPRLVGLGTSDLGQPDDIKVEPASAGDATVIAEIAGRIFDTGRLHVDPLIDAAIGDRRYRAWAANAFSNPGQSVLKCRLDEQIVGFFVIERPSATAHFWSLIGLAPGLSGQGLGTRVGRAMLRWHRDEGVDEISTSMSSHNVAAMNLYMRLGFRFPAPSVTLHWCPHA